MRQHSMFTQDIAKNMVWQFYYWSAATTIIIITTWDF